MMPPRVLIGRLGEAYHPWIYLALAEAEVQRTPITRRQATPRSSRYTPGHDGQYSGALNVGKQRHRTGSKVGRPASNSSCLSPEVGG